MRALVLSRYQLTPPQTAMRYANCVLTKSTDPLNPPLAAAQEGTYAEDPFACGWSDSGYATTNTPMVVVRRRTRACALINAQEPSYDYRRSLALHSQPGLRAALPEPTAAGHVVMAGRAATVSSIALRARLTT